MALRVKFGKAPAFHDPRTLKFSNYIKAGLPPPPEKYSSLDRIIPVVGTSNPAKIFPMDGNDRYGDCVIAAVAHMITNFHGLVGRKSIPSEQEVVKTYLDWTKGEDSGCVMFSVAKAWTKAHFFNDKIDAFVSLHRADPLDVKRAVVWYGGIFLGFNVQAAAISDFEANRPWTPGPAEGGHGVVIIGYDEKYLHVLTWGGIARATWDWWNEMVDEAYVLLPDEAKDPSFAPGFDYALLESDLSALRA